MLIKDDLDYDWIEGDLPSPERETQLFCPNFNPNYDPYSNQNFPRFSGQI